MKTTNAHAECWERERERERERENTESLKQWYIL